MNKKIKTFLIIGIVCAALCAAYPHLYRGNSSPVTKEEIGASVIYTDADIQAAMDAVQKSFGKDFRDCAMTELWYDETVSSQEADEWKEQYQSDEAIVLLSNFEVGPSGGDGSLEPNSVCKNWKWVLVRDSGSGGWALKTWGYA